MNNIIFTITLLLLLIVVFKYALPTIQHKTQLGDLTGNSFYKKLTDSNVLYVEYIDTDLNKKYRIATKEDIEILTKLNYIK